MSARLIMARKLWYDGELAIGNCEAVFNCDTFIGTSPRNVWLTPINNCVGNTAYALNLSLPNPLPGGSLQGVWLEFANGTGMVIDALSVEDVVTACNACCGTTTSVPPRYGGLIPVPFPLVASTYTFTRVDDGGWYAYNKASLDYWPGWITNTFSRISHDDTTGVTTYSFSAYREPVWIDTDTFVSATPRVFTSNVAPTLLGGQVYRLTVNADGANLVPSISATTVPNLVTAATGRAAYSALGTYAAINTNTQITLTSSTVDQGGLTITAVTPAVYVSNNPGAPSGGQQVRLTSVLNGNTMPPKQAATVAALVTALTADPVFNVWGTWAADGTALQLTSSVADTASLTLTLVV